MFTLKNRWSHILFDADGVPGGGVTPPLDPAAAPIIPVIQPASDPSKAVEEWKSRATGWQKLYNEFEAARKSSEAQLAAVATNFQTTDVAKKDLETKLSATTEALAAQKLRSDRADMVISEFPQLIPFFKGDLLPQGSGDELKTKLTAFAALQVSMGVVPQVPPVGTPPAPEHTPPPTNSDALFKQAREKLMAGDTAGYTAGMDQYYASLKK